MLDSRNKRHELDFEEYIRNVEPSKREKSNAWSAAIGLQQVDGLTPSRYLFETARRNIDGDITIDEVQKLINSYYKSKTKRNDGEDDAEEADKVSARIAKILSEKSFNFSPSYLIAIHGKLFQGIYKFAGRIRDYDITKKEWVLNGDTVMYGAAFELKTALDYDFEQERNFVYGGLSMGQIVEHLAYFVSHLWQIHAFGEGNTRTIAVFTIKYLRSMGLKVLGDIFAKNSWYFRNALVRANYRNVAKGIEQNSDFLKMFFRNMLMGEHNELKNRFLHIAYKMGKTGVTCKKVGFNVGKVGIGGEKVGFSVLIQKIRESNYNVTAKNHLMSVVEGIQENQIFGAREVMQLALCSSTSATALIKKMVALELVEKVTGHGNGKYRWKINNSDH